MDEHKRKEEEDEFHESTTEQQPRNQEAEGNSEESMDQRRPDGYNKEGRSAEEEPTVQLKEGVKTGCSEEEDSSPSSLLDIVFTNPCSLLQYLLRRACAGWCWGLHGAFDDDGPKPLQAAAVVAPEAVAQAANATEQQGDGGGETKANYFYMQEVVTRVFAVTRGRPPSGRPGPPRPGRGGSGGSHN